MTPIPRRIGWVLMAFALAIGWGAKGVGMTHYGPLPAAAVALLVGGVGVLLVITDMMVRGIYAGLDQASSAVKVHRPSETAGACNAPVGGDADDIAVVGDADRP